MATEIALENLDSAEGLLSGLHIVTDVENPPAHGYPAVTVTATYIVRIPFLGTVLGLEPGIEGRVMAEASVVKRTEW